MSEDFKFLQGFSGTLYPLQPRNAAIRQERHRHDVSMIVAFVSPLPVNEQMRIIAGMVTGEVGCHSQVPWQARRDASIKLVRRMFASANPNTPKAPV